eukprot:TRINITY_DN34934_c0_g1_i2.p1 TRINITY_DN34934_c0_g1~~TRINITY_DN34934_c0_g1_i2.p1  ORF type:complete len:354 (+),score=46.16 TRINITY_DN34934_c0_g1_i2:40-1101(+)
MASFVHDVLERLKLPWCCATSGQRERENFASDDTWFDAESGDECWDELTASVEAAGVPRACAGDVARLSRSLSLEKGTEPLCDPLTLYRFYLARDCDVVRAADMHRQTVRWREDYRVAKIMAHHGRGEDYADDGSPSFKRGIDRWDWERSPVSLEAELTRRHAFFGRLREPDPMGGGPILVWRVGRADASALITENLLEPFKRALVSHLEDTLQFARAASMKRRRLVYAKVIIDVDGINLSILRQAWVIKNMLAFSIAYYPEVIHSVTIVRSPWVFTSIWRALHPLLDARMRQKFRVLGPDFASELKEHSGLDLSLLPKFLGGEASDDEVCSAKPVPRGTGQSLETPSWAKEK